MYPHPRYEIVASIAAGDFATVYRGRDRELGREVAIKQIHPQFLTDPRQLELYWREAQLLASLEHPHIMTIYDIVRTHGWLILELMQGNLQQLAQGQPLDLEYLRSTLAAGLQALAYLHSSGVVHGDVKPSNLLVDRRGNVKLGDFGLARRVKSDQGSLVKGTTRYMAPELISQQFGAVGPHSDLYSLGFSAYELMCGAQFESLFPGLDAFGRDRQVAWMMWHAAADRRLPEIGRVLEGVPPDLAHVIQKLTQKSAVQRYRTAEEALRDLHTSPVARLPKKPGEEEAAAAAEAAAAKRKRYLAVGALAGSLVLSLAMLFIPTGSEKPKPTVKLEPTRGVVRSLLLDRRTVIIDDTATGEPKEIVIRPGDRIVLNDKVSLLQELKEQDQVTIRPLRDPTGAQVTEIIASRPRQDRGTIKELSVDEGTLTVAAVDGSTTTDLELTVPASAKLTLNAQPTFAGKSLTLADFKPDDRVDVEHYQDEQHRIVTALHALRTIEAAGVVRQIDLKKNELSLAASSDQNAPVVIFPLAERCEISLNGRRFVADKTLAPVDLRPGDVVTLEHDTHITRIDAQRKFTEGGVVRNLRYDLRSLEVQPPAAMQTVTYLVAAECTVKLSGEPADFDDLRQGDQITLTHESPDAKSPTALTIEATRPIDRSKWLLVIGNQKYDDASLSPLQYSTADADLLRATLANRYAVAPDQTLALTDESRIRLEQAVSTFLAKIKSARQVIVYYAGHAYSDEGGTVFLAPKEFSLPRIDATAVPLKWLVDQMEACTATEKLLLLDACHEVAEAEAARQPSSAEMVQTIQGNRSMPGLKTVTVIASCSKGERGRVYPPSMHGAFAHYLAHGYSGRADRNRDLLIEQTEIFEFVKTSLVAATSELAAPQTPVLFLPDNTPPRLADDAKTAIRRLALLLSQPQIDIIRAAENYHAARALAPKEPEAKLLYGLALWKAGQFDEATQQFEEVKIERPGIRLPWEISAWLHFERQTNTAGVNELAAMVLRFPPPKKLSDKQPAQVLQILEWAGRLREYSAQAAVPNKRAAVDSLRRLDDAAGKLGDEAAAAYKAGRDYVTGITAAYDRQINDENLTDSKRFQARIDRTRLKNYVSFPLPARVDEVLSWLEE